MRIAARGDNAGRAKQSMASTNKANAAVGSPAASCFLLPRQSNTLVCRVFDAWNVPSCTSCYLNLENCAPRFDWNAGFQPAGGQDVRAPSIHS